MKSNAAPAIKGLNQQEVATMVDSLQKRADARPFEQQDVFNSLLGVLTRLDGRIPMTDWALILEAAVWIKMNGSSPRVAGG